MQLSEHSLFKMNLEEVLVLLSFFHHCVIIIIIVIVIVIINYCYIYFKEMANSPAWEQINRD